MDDQNKNGDLLLPAVEKPNEEPLRDIVEILRSEVENQTKTIDSLSKTMAMYEVERIHNHNYVAFLQAELHHLARHVADHHMEAHFEALRREVSSELGYLRTAMSHSSNQGVSCSNAHTSSDIQSDAAISRLTQELYHSRNVLWEQVTELRAEIHHIHGQLRNQRTEMQRKLSERLNKDMRLEKLMDTCQAQELSLDISEIQTKFEAVRISKDKACQKTGGTGTPPGVKATPYNSDSDETQSGSRTKINIPRTKERDNVCARGK